MSLVSGPGRGGTAAGAVPDELKLVIDNHVKYIQTLDQVRCSVHHRQQMLKLIH